MGMHFNLLVLVCQLSHHNVTKVTECRGMPILYHARCAAACAVTLTPEGVVAAYTTQTASGGLNRYGSFAHQPPRGVGLSAMRLLASDWLSGPRSACSCCFSVLCAALA